MKDERVEINNVFYLYAIGNSSIAIWTDPQGQWGTVPEFAKVELIIERVNWEAIPNAVNDAIRAKVAEQRKRATVKQ